MLKRKEKDRELRLEWGVWGLEEKRLIFSCKKFEILFILRYIHLQVIKKVLIPSHCIMLFQC